VILNRTALREYEPRDIWQKVVPDRVTMAKNLDSQAVSWQMKPINLESGGNGDVNIKLKVDEEVFAVLLLIDRTAAQKVTGGTLILNEEVSYPLRAQVLKADGNNPNFYFQSGKTALVIDFAGVKPFYPQMAQEQRFFEGLSNCKPVVEPAKPAYKRFETIIGA
jgi:hypothetical protein